MQWDMDVRKWANSSLINRGEATGSLPATLPVEAMREGREVGGRKPPFVIKAWVGTTILQRFRWAYAAWCESAVTESRRPIAFNTPSRVVSLGFPSALSDL